MFLLCYFFCSQYILCSFRFSLFGGIIRFYLNIIFCSIGLSSLGHHRKFFYKFNSLFLCFSSIVSHPNFFFFHMIIIYSSTKELILKYSISALKNLNVEFLLEFVKKEDGKPVIKSTSCIKHCDY